MKKTNIIGFLIAIALALASLGIFGCGPSTHASVKTGIVKTQSNISAKVSAQVRVPEVNTAEAALEAAVASPTKTVAVMPATVRIDLYRPFEYPDKYGFTSARLGRRKPNMGFKGIGHDHFARADV